MSNKYLEVTNLKKSFGGLKAVDVQSLNLNKNELTSIIGPNGAGKTTFFDLISGFLDSDEGKVYLIVEIQIANFCMDSVYNRFFIIACISTS